MEKDVYTTKPTYWTRLRKVLAHPALLFWTLPYLMVLLVIGTLDQTRLGLYAAQNKYFASLFFTLGPVPLPGGLFICGLLFLNLLVKFVWESEWSLRRAGTHLAHIGVIILLLGGLVSNLSREEWVMSLPLDTPVNEASDYFLSEVVLLKNDQEIARQDFGELKMGQALFREKIPFEINVIELCHACQIVLREDTDLAIDTADWRGVAGKMALEEGKTSLKAEENLQGITFALSGVDENQDGHYIAFLFFPKPSSWQIGDDTYSLIIRRKIHALPFTLELKNFEADFYPASQMARSYSSDVQVQYENKTYPAHIAMNKPLSTDLYTVYQSSYYQGPDGEPISVLAIVKNHGRYFPYIGTTLITLGLLFYLILRVRMTRQEAI